MSVLLLRTVRGGVVPLLAVVVLSSPQPAAAQTPSACAAVDPCQQPRRAGEVSLLFLGDSGYGEGGASEWGGHAQAAVARRCFQLPSPAWISSRLATM